MLTEDDIHTLNDDSTHELYAHDATSESILDNDNILLGSIHLESLEVSPEHALGNEISSIQEELNQALIQEAQGSHDTIIEQNRIEDIVNQVITNSRNTEATVQPNSNTTDFSLHETTVSISPTTPYAETNHNTDDIKPDSLTSEVVIHRIDLPNEVRSYDDLNQLNQTLLSTKLSDDSKVDELLKFSQEVPNDLADKMTYEARTSPGLQQTLEAITGLQAQAYQVVLQQQMKHTDYTDTWAVKDAHDWAQRIAGKPGEELQHLLNKQLEKSIDKANLKEDVKKGLEEAAKHLKDKVDDKITSYAIFASMPQDVRAQLIEQVIEHKNSVLESYLEQNSESIANDVLSDAAFTLVYHQHPELRNQFGEFISKQNEYIAEFMRNTQ